MPYTPPEYLSDGFTCPLCNFHAHQLWFKMYYGPHAHDVIYMEKLDLSRCERCEEYLLWFDKKVMFPVVNNVPPPRQDMPQDVKKIYEEAKGILFRSTRASAALLRTAVGLLVDEIVGENKNSRYLRHWVSSSARKDSDCQAADTGREGLDRIRKEDFDLILLDLTMPDFSGLDVIKSLKQQGLIELKNIVIFTASSNQDLLKEIRDHGVKEIFKKPFSLDQLIALIEKYRPIA